MQQLRNFQQLEFSAPTCVELKYCYNGLNTLRDFAIIFDNMAAIFMVFIFYCRYLHYVYARDVRFTIASPSTWKYSFTASLYPPPDDDTRVIKREASNHC